MLGLMMDRPLLISQLIEHAAEYHGDDEIVSWSVEGPIHRHTCADAARRSGQLAKALEVLGADTSLSGARLAGELTSLIGLRGKPTSGPPPPIFPGGLSANRTSIAERTSRSLRPT